MTTLASTLENAPNTPLASAGNDTTATHAKSRNSTTVLPRMLENATATPPETSENDTTSIAT